MLFDRTCLLCTHACATRAHACATRTCREGEKERGGGERGGDREERRLPPPLSQSVCLRQLRVRLERAQRLWTPRLRRWQRRRSAWCAWSRRKAMFLCRAGTLLCVNRVQRISWRRRERARYADSTLSKSSNSFVPKSNLSCDAGGGAEREEKNRGVR